MAKIKNIDNTKCSGRWEATGILIHCKMIYHLWETIWWLLIKLHIHLTHNPEIPLLCIYLREIKTYAHTKLTRGILSGKEKMKMTNFQCLESQTECTWRGEGLIWPARYGARLLTGACKIFVGKNKFVCRREGDTFQRAAWTPKGAGGGLVA